MIDLYHSGLLEKDISPWDKVIELKQMYDREVKSLGNLLSEAERGAARIAEDWEKVLGGQRTIEDFIKKVGPDRNVDSLLHAAFLTHFDYDIGSYLRLPENDGPYEATTKIMQLLAYGQFGKCRKCKETLDIRGMWAEGIWSGDDGSVMKNPSHAELMLWAYCKCDSSKKIRAAEEYQQAYFKKFKKLRKKPGK